MCGRFTQFKPIEEIAREFHAPDPDIDWQASFNIAPTVQVPVVRRSQDDRELTLMRWGLIPSWATPDKKLPLMHNARAETVAKLPSYRSAFKTRRCIVPANGYMEWRAGTPKQPFYFQRADGRQLAFAGIWEHNPEAGDTVSIITTSPNKEAGEIHDRMPVILSETYWERWFEESPLTDGERQQVLRPAPDGTLSVWPVSRAVGNVRNNSPANIEPQG